MIPPAGQADPKEAERHRRLQSEAEFQNQRVRAMSRGQVEARDRFLYLTDEAMRRFEERVAGVKGRRVLVVGCGQGTVTPLARRGAIVTGIDVSSDSIEKLNQAIVREGLKDRASAAVMDAESLDFPDGTFDVVCCSGVLHHLDVEKSLTAWAKVLKPGGRIVMVEPMAWNPAAAIYRVFTPSMRTPDEHPLKPVDFRIMAKHFAQVDVDAYALTSTLSIPLAFLPLQPLKQIVARVLDGVDSILLRLMPPLRYFCWVCVIELQHPRR